MKTLYTTSELTFEDFIKYPEITIEEHSFTFISGRSGCGKSTYLKFLNGTLPSPQNCVFYNEKPIRDYDILDYRSQVLLIPQNVYLIPGTITDNFHFYYDNRQQKRLSDAKIREFLKLCCIEANLNDRCETMSGGERQRVFLAIFMSFASHVVLLDEPTSALDEKTSDLLMHHLKHYCKAQRLTAVCVCHNPQLVEKYADAAIYFGGEDHESSH